MERGTPFPHYQLPKSNSGLNVDHHNNNPNPTLTNNANMNISMVPVQPQTCTVRGQDQYMPIANVLRIMRRILPLHAKISDDAKETIQQCVSEYISFVTGEANERCQREQRKTITVEDILYAMGSLGFEDYVGPLELFINRYREFESGRGCSLKGESSSFKPLYVGNGIGFNDSHFGPHHGPVHVPTHGPTHGPNRGLVHGLVHGSVHGPPHGPEHGPAQNPAFGPTHGLIHGSVHDSTHGPSHGPVHGQANTLSHGPPPSGPYGYDMLDQSMVMSGGRYYHLGSGHDGSGGSGSSAPSMNGRPIFDQFGNQYK